MALYHWTANAGQLGITRDGFRVRTPRDRMGETKYRLLEDLTPPHVRFLYNVCWFTDIDRPLPGAIGVSGASTDKVEHLFRVRDETGIQPWRTFVRSAPPESRQAVEDQPGARPETWFVSTVPVLVRFVQDRALWVP